MIFQKSLGIGALGTALNEFVLFAAEQKPVVPTVVNCGVCGEFFTLVRTIIIGTAGGAKSVLGDGAFWVELNGGRVVMEEPEFWLVWCETGYPPKYKHSSRPSAEAEAVRLARNNPGKKFHVLMHAATARAIDVEFKRVARSLDSFDDDIPF